MNKSASLRGALAVLIVAVTAATPLVARVQSQDAQLEVELANSQVLEDQVRQVESDLFWAQTNRDLLEAQVQRDAARHAGELDVVRREVEQLKKDVESARVTTRPVYQPVKPPHSGGAATVKAEAEVKVKVSVGKSGNCESYRALVAAHFPASQVNNALLTMRKESGCRANAVSPAKDYGLMQINFPSHSKRVGGNANLLFDPATNIRVAAQIYRESGWCPWVAVRGTLC